MNTYKTLLNKAIEEREADYPFIFGLINAIDLVDYSLFQLRQGLIDSNSPGLHGSGITASCREGCCVVTWHAPTHN